MSKELIKGRKKSILKNEMPNNIKNTNLIGNGTLCDVATEYATAAQIIKIHDITNNKSVTE